MKKAFGDPKPKKKKELNDRQLFDDTHCMLIELENYFSNKEPHGEFHTKIYDLLNEIEKSKFWRS